MEMACGSNSGVMHLLSGDVQLQLFQPICVFRPLRGQAAAPVDPRRFLNYSVPHTY